MTTVMLPVKDTLAATQSLSFNSHETTENHRTNSKTNISNKLTRNKKDNTYEIKKTMLCSVRCSRVVFD